MRKAVGRRLLIIALAVLSLTFNLTRGFSQVAVIPDPDQDFISGLSSPDLEGPSAGASSPTGTGRPPRVGPNVRVNAPQQAFPNGLLGRSETTVAGTDDGRFLVVGFNDAQGFCGPPFGAACTPQTPPGLSGFAFSSDGGLTWTDGGAPPVIDHVFTRGDPWLALGGTDGATFFYANLAVHDTTGASFGVSIHRGHFGLGGAFTWDDVRTFNSSNPNDFLDKEAIAAQPGTPNAYVSVTNFIGLPCPAFPNTMGAFGQIEVWRTHDSGDSWQGPAIVSPDMTNVDVVDPNCGNTGTLQQSSVSAIGPNGELFVAWQQGPTFSGKDGSVVSTDAKIKVARSLDGGVTFSTPVTVADINSMRQNSPVGYNRDRINDHPRVAVAMTGRDMGRVYVVYYGAVAPVTADPIAPCPAPLTGNCRAQRLTSSQVFLKFSDDKGSTWSSAIPLAPAPPATGVKRWWPTVSVEPGGNVDVIYYESKEHAISTNPFCTIRVSSGGLRRRGTANSLVDTFWVRSIDGGATFSAPMRVTTATSNWCTVASNVRPNFGDYIGSVSGGNRVLATWADGRNGVPDTFYSTGLGAGKSP